MILLSSLISLILGLGIVFYLRKQDLYEKEPWSSLFMVLFIGGGISIVYSLVFYNILKIFGIYSSHTITSAFLVIGPVEELGKLLAFATVAHTISKDMNEPIDSILYMSMIALGFSIYENILYIIGSDTPLFIAFLRSFLCSPAHIVFSFFMGLAYYVQKENGNNLSGILAAFLIASILHGLYDALVFARGDFTPVILIIGLSSLFWMIFRLKIAQSPFRQRFSETEPDKSSNEKMTCRKCQAEDSLIKNLYQRFEVFECISCKHILGETSQFLRIVNAYAPSEKTKSLQVFYYRHELKEVGKKKIIDDTVYLEKNDNFFSAEKNAFCDWIEKLNQRHIEKTQKQPWVNFLLDMIGWRS